MDLASNKRTLGIVHIVYGTFNALIFIFIGVIISTFLPFIMDVVVEEEGPEAAVIFEMVANIIRVVFTFIFILSALPSIIGGIGVLQGKSWGLTVALIAGCVSIFSFPFGTALGIYSIYVYIQNNKQKNDDQNKG